MMLTNQVTPINEEVK